ncbi:alpha-protein kinase 1 [Scaptodrosophila lebanonensis]|uniref:Alpha-protein kinase 1 n=1 Tax=Drosophila lebanonensis TaxID=7225 RepID=A0A6J2U4M6_DROLE|nr:alpha-protein kinase 1 [Scaptodrosophila lebanonensis]
MKLICCLLALAVGAQFGLAAADISLKLRQQQQQHQQQQQQQQQRGRYLPPAPERVIVKEQYYKLQGQQPTQQQRSQQVFEEASYGNSRYQIFEVHNHYEAAPQQLKRKAPRQQSQAAYSAAAYLPPTTQATQPLTYQSAVQPQQQSVISTASTATATAQSYQAAGYLPPTASSVTHLEPVQQQQVVPLPKPTYQAPISSISNNYAQPLSKPVYRGPSYLPPTTNAQAPPTVQTTIEQTHSQSQADYRAPGYLPPGYDFSNPEVKALHAPGYLPPGYDFANPEQAPQPVPTPLQPQPQPQPLQQLQPQLQVQTDAVQPASNDYQAPGYLPPGYEFNNPELRQAQPQLQPQPQPQPQAIVQTQPTIVQTQPIVQPQQQAVSYQQQQQQQQQQIEYHQQQQHQQQQQAVVVAPTQPTLRHPGALPDGYDFIKPENSEAAIAELHSLQTQTQLLKKQHQQAVLLQQQQQQQGQQQQQITQLGPQQVVVQSQINVATHGQGADIIYGRPKAAQQPLAPLAPQTTIVTATATAATTATSYQAQQQQYNAPGYLPPVAPVAAPPAPVAVPVPAPAPPPTQVTHIHPLSSYMNTVQPFTRYAQPAQQQQLHHHQHQHHHHNQQVHQQQVVQQHHVEVAPMYREQSKRPRFYAPAMSYVSNAVPQAYQHHQHQHHHQQHHHQQQQQQQQQQHTTGPVLSIAAQQSLQKFMPKEVQMAVNVAVAAATPTPTHAHAHGATTRVRTVQILKSNGVRTFKVLESLDQAGVKTIKILGATNEQPIGHHQVVKVVTQNAHSGVENHVQTVKIFDDQKEFVVPPTPTITTTQTSSNSHNGYLPPRRPRASTTLKLQRY